MAGCEQPDWLTAETAGSRGLSHPYGVFGRDTSPIKLKTVRSIVELCHEMGLLVVAEGVETLEERDVLIGLGCDLLQGFLFAKPGPPFPSVQR